MMKILIIVIAAIQLSLISTFAQNSASKMPPKSRVLTFHSCNEKAIYFPKPDYPKTDASISGIVNVVIRTDEEGNIKFAKAVTGHPLIRQESEKAALKAKLKPTFLEGKPVGITCLLLYNFGLPDRPKIEESKKEISVESVNKKSISIPKNISPICKRKN
jgi:hypothetical protein